MARGSERRRVADRLHSAAIYVLRYAREADRQSAVGPAQLSALSVLTYGGPCTIGELAAAEQVAPPTMTRIVQALKARGFVRLKRSSSDARVTICEASASGIDILKKAREARLNRIEALLSQTKPGDIALLGKALEDVFGDASP
jgi:DNA-binding MarR family transcriptional regulator